MITAFRMGHVIYWDTVIEWWRWQDTNEPIPRPGERCERSCKLCGRPPDAQGRDPCLGTIPGARAACCGHGVQPGYVTWPDGTKQVAPVLTEPPVDVSMDWQTALVTVRSRT